MMDQSYMHLKILEHFARPVDLNAHNLDWILSCKSNDKVYIQISDEELSLILLKTSHHIKTFKLSEKK